ncbi:MAG: 1-acyl-sn-glycerol-3-phosphate acyltransferase, partial [Candidatus Protistobacter heckmanni]|nr:1-acyl-sn-glycerol-3-phosphate acyltransferase [Candidatus Protistobacter heckmanni]
MAFSALLPVVRLFLSREKVRRMTLWLIHQFFRALVRVLRIAGVMRVDLRDAEKLGGAGHIVVANHPTYLDVVVLLSVIPGACCVVKRSHWSNPCLWGIVRAAGYISNDDGAVLVNKSAERLRKGRPLIIFPEGTRSPPSGGLHPFSRSFAHIALRSGRPIQPVLIACHPPAFAKGQRWYRIPERPFEIRVAPLKLINPSAEPANGATQAEQVSPIAARSLTSATREYIQQQLVAYGFA